MAAQTMTTDLNLRLILAGGLDENGKMVTRNKVYRFVKVDAQPEGIYNTALAIASLQTYSLQSIQMINTADITMA